MLNTFGVSHNTKGHSGQSLKTLHPVTRAHFIHRPILPTSSSTHAAAEFNDLDQINVAKRGKNGVEGVGCVCWPQKLYMHPLSLQAGSAFTNSTHWFPLKVA